MLRTIGDVKDAHGSGGGFEPHEILVDRCRLPSTSVGEHMIVMMIVRGSHPKTVGDLSTAMVMARLVQAGRSILLPFGENQRYDLVIDERGGFVRVQCKTGRVYRGVIWFPTCSSTYHHPNNQGKKTYKRSYDGQADVFGVYCPDTDRVYMVPVSEVGSVSASLRVNPTKNGQSKGIRWAHEFELKCQSPG